MRFIAPIAGACHAEVTLLGIVEDRKDEGPLREALQRGVVLFRERQIEAEVITKAGDPVDEIRKRTEQLQYNIVIVGAERKGEGAPSWMSEKAYRLIKLTRPPVLVFIGERVTLERILVCSGGGRYIHKAVELISRLARAPGMEVTLLHVMAEPPAMYANLTRQEEDVARLLSSNSVLGQNLVREKKALEAKGVKTTVRLRHGLVATEISREVREGGYDMVVAGSAPGDGPIRNYVMGDVTSEIVNHAACPVLVVRGDPKVKTRNFFARLFGS